MNVGDIVLQREALFFLQELAHHMGVESLKYHGRITAADVHFKCAEDPVTVADKAIQDLVVRRVRHAFGDRISLLTEESASTFQPDPAKPLFIIDELDGTVNFSRYDGKGLPPANFCHLLALAEPTEKGLVATVGVVYNPVSKEYFFATIDGDASRRVGMRQDSFRVDTHTTAYSPGRTRMSVDIHRELFPPEYARYEAVVQAMERVREANPQRAEAVTGGLDLIALAQGRTAVAVFAKAANWDYAAPSVILKQAGGDLFIINEDSEIKPWSLQMKNPGAYYPAVATNGQIQPSEVFIRAHD